jgi:hypothetical protein
MITKYRIFKQVGSEMGWVDYDPSQTQEIQNALNSITNYTLTKYVVFSLDGSFIEFLDEEEASVLGDYEIHVKGKIIDDRIIYDIELESANSNEYAELFPTDWAVIQSKETGNAINNEISAQRNAIRSKYRAIKIDIEERWTQHVLEISNL